MLRRVLLVLGLCLLLAAGVAGWRFSRFLHTDVVRVDDRFYVVLGGGGNTAILVGNDGVLVVDPKFLSPGRRLPAIIRSITDKPVRVIINTHYHSDHTHGNTNYAPRTDVIAHRRTRAHLLALDGSFWQVEPAWSLLPNDLVDGEKDIPFGDETVRIIHPGQGHTDGDLVVYFPTRQILVTGDLFLHAMYPFIDLRAGGTARQWVTTLDAVLTLPAVQRVVPGHGPISTRADVERFQGYLRSLVSQVAAQAARGRSLKEVNAAVDLQAYDDFRGLPFFTSRAKNVQWVYEELKGRGER